MMGISVNVTKRKISFVLIFIFGLLNFAEAAPVTTRITTTAPLTDLQKAKDFLSNFGYLPEVRNRNAHAESDMKAAIEKMQRYAGLNVTGILDNSTMKQMAKPRCQIPDFSNTKLRFQTSRKWRNRNLSYKISNGPKNYLNMKPTDVPLIIAKSIKDWTSVSNLVVNPTVNRANINLAFVARNHGDGDNFDGPGRVLAHASLPEDGDLHFDNDDVWSDATSAGNNLRQITTHELGHSFGILHSNVKGAVMWPWFDGYVKNFALHSDDIKAIQSLYGSPATKKTTIKPNAKIRSITIQ